MKILVPCQQCCIEGNLDSFVDTTPQENNICHFTCSQGHESTAYIEAFKFELLFDSGLCAIRDKYYLESVLSLTAALERFYEFSTKLLLKTNGVSNDIYEKMFKNISNQSERQPGAFICIYTSIYKECPILLESNMIGFRNKVVHKGYLPTKDEVMKYANTVYDTIKPIYLKLRKDYQKIIMEMITDECKKTAINQKTNNPIETIALPFSFSTVSSLSSLEKESFLQCWSKVINTGFY